MARLKSNSPTKTSAIIVRVQDDTKEQIMKLAEKSRREVSDYMRLIIEDTIKHQVTV